MGVKVFITGVGSDLGTQMARVLEGFEQVKEIAGVDMFPPRRYLARTKFFMSHYDDSERISDVISGFDPDVIINFGVYEPGARLGFSRARGATHASVAGIIHASKKIEKRKPVHVISRSSVCVYGFNDSSKTYDETSPLSPDTPYGEMCRNVEEELFNNLESVTIVRTAPELGAHVPHPLARVLNQMVIPIQMRVPFTKEVGFPLISPRDAVDIFVKVAMKNDSTKKFHKVLHASTSSNANMLMAARVGGKVPFFTTGFGFAAVKQASYLAGAPIDPHIEMLIRRGISIDSTSTRMYLEITSQDSPIEILRELYSGEEKTFESLIVSKVKNENV